MNNTKLFIILGNQLFNPNLYFEDIRTYDFYMSEDYGLCSYVKHHKLKILHTLSSMRSYKDELTDMGVHVHYLGIEDNSFYEDYFTKLGKFLKKKKYDVIQFFEIEDKFFEKKMMMFLNNINVKVKIIKSPMFLFDRDDFINFFKNKKKPLMASFYKHSRKKYNILIKDDNPVGGKWSFDDENRKKLPKGLVVPKVGNSKKSKHTIKLTLIINSIFKKNVGSLDNFWIPTDRKESHKFMQDFITNRFNLFGDYEDAISKNNDFLFHSALSPLLNVGLITPKELLSKIKNYESKIKINSYEGFIRQIIGWREFIRGVYQKYDDKFINGNYFQNKRKMNSSWYKGETGIDPLDEAILKAYRLGWNNHIERLMVISNIMNLSQINPREVYNWFMEFYVDASDWVMVPNVYGMGMFSDGGIFATKPYVCASSYILKMSNHTKGPWTDILDGLYWKFIDTNRDKLKLNPRIAIMTKMIDNMDIKRKSKIYSAAEEFLDNHTTK